MKQHGFARDADFELCPGSEDARYVLHAPEGRPNYPFSFDLTATYKADGDILTCQWTVINLGDRPMDFQIGAHPAFLLPDFDPADEVHGYIQCLEPWCGIADSDSFNGDIADRDCNHHLLPGETFDFCYRIQVF